MPGLKGIAACCEDRKSQMDTRWHELGEEGLTSTEECNEAAVMMSGNLVKQVSLKKERSGSSV